MKEILRLVLVLTVISGAAGVLLAFTNKITTEPIAAAKQVEKRAAFRDVLPTFDNDPGATTHAVQTADGQTVVFYVGRKDGAFAGAAFEAVSTKGYGGPIKLMVGINPDKTVRRIKILEQTETPGLGTKVAQPDFAGQFDNKPVSATKWAVQKDGGDIVAITGATISSRAVTGAVRQGLELYGAHADAIAAAGK